MYIVLAMNVRLYLFPYGIDVVFWTGSGLPSVNGYHCSYEDDM